EDGKIYVVRGGRKQWVMDSEWIVEHGYRWPGDVNVIPRSELDAMPTGDPIYSAAHAPKGTQPAPATPKSRYKGQLGRRPGSTPEDGKVYFVRDGVKHWFMSSNWILQHVFRGPQDVKLTPRVDLDAIPAGEPFSQSPQP